MKHFCHASSERASGPKDLMSRPQWVYGDPYSMRGASGPCSGPALGSSQTETERVLGL